MLYVGWDGLDGMVIIGRRSSMSTSGASSSIRTCCVGWPRHSHVREVIDLSSLFSPSLQLFPTTKQ